MLSLYRRFPLGGATVRQFESRQCGGCEFYLNAHRELVCKTPQRSFVVAEDVYTYCTDAEVLWYSKYGDLVSGMDVVYRTDANNVYDCKRGVVDADGRFLYYEDGYLYCETIAGDVQKVCTREAMGSLVGFDGEREELSIHQIEGMMQS